MNNPEELDLKLKKTDSGPLLGVTHGRRARMWLRPSSETGQFTSGNQRKSVTFKWTEAGHDYRVQVQVTRR